MIEFTVSTGDNPVPYKRTTTRQKYKDPDYQKYYMWKNIVISRFALTYKKMPPMILKKDQKYYVDVMIYFKNKKHGDPDNIAKGINDAIFVKPLSDKYVAGSYDFAYDKENPRVEIKIKEGLK